MVTHRLITAEAPWSACHALVTLDLQTGLGYLTLDDSTATDTWHVPVAECGRQFRAQKWITQAKQRSGAEQQQENTCCHGNRCLIIMMRLMVDRAVGSN